mmetsp:Transcript_131570/g.294417  ORF Transcript_131570/g.294417 Transcript_131570/m.294417 type:complete len:248 (+) Transcript_131570:657-1400(+)
MLTHARVERHIVVLGPTAQGREPEHWLLVALGLEFRVCVLHEERMTVVDGVPKLEDEDSVRIHRLELGLQGSWGESVLVHPIIVDRGLDHGDLPADEPIPSLVDELDVGVLFVRDAKGPPSALLLHVLIDGGGRHDGKDGTIRCSERDLRLPIDLSLLLSGARLDDGYRHRYKLAIQDHVLVVGALQILLLGHEAIERAGPTLSQDMDPLHFLLRQCELLKLLGRLEQGRPLCRRNYEVHQCSDLAC